MGECTSVGLDVRMMCPLPALLPSASVNPIASRVRSLSSRTLCYSDPAGRLALSMSPLHAYIGFFISLRLSLPWGASRPD